MTKLLQMTVTVEIEDGFQQEQQFAALHEFDRKRIPERIEEEVLKQLTRANSVAFQQASVHVEN